MSVQKKAFCAFTFSLLIFACAAQKQGIKGQVYWISGNQMPRPGTKATPQQGTQRQLYIYELTYTKDCEQKDGFFTSVPTKLITQIPTLPDGTFKVKLAVGTYSVFTKEPKGLFANLLDKDSAINPVIVKPKEYAWVTIAIDYEAAY
jgi:hypothetical protein